jgi:hypothetical protein
MRRSTLAVIALIGLAVLSACNRKAEGEAPVVNNLVEPPVMDEPENVAPPAPAPVENKVAPIPAPDVDADQQMLDDAAAVGMTARIPPAEQVAPVDESNGQTASDD